MFGMKTLKQLKVIETFNQGLKRRKNMELYRDINRDSGVAAYEIGPDFIRVQFNYGSVYLYTYASAGQQNVLQMKILALAGKGLNSFIDKYVVKLFAAKES